MKDLKLVHQLFIGKVIDEIGSERTTELLKEAKEAFAIPVVIARFSDEQIDDLINELDEYARDYDHYEFGLPNYDTHMDNMRNIVKVKLNGL